ncbi:MAG: alpha-galactosidase [Actinomycetota bacterium]
MQHLLVHGASSSLLLGYGDGTPPHVLHWGRAIAGDVPSQIAAGLSRPLAHNSIDVEAPIALVTELGSGFFGSPGIKGSRPDGSGFAPRFRVEGTPVHDRDTLVFDCVDEVAELRLRLELRLAPDSDVIRLRHSLTNLGSTRYQVDRLCVTLPLPARATDLLDFTGRWCDEFHSRRQTWDTGALINENRRGRSSHDHVAVLWAGTAGFDEQHGEVWGFHLGWSGNCRIMAERLADGRRYLQAGELLFPGELGLEPGETMEAPPLYAAYSGIGLGGVSRAFHRELRSRPSHPSPDKPRPVILNTWEAVYFQHDVDTLERLADVAADVGVERFVLDDGWFRGRNDDTAGLGDWWVDEEKYPDGLEPLISHVTGLGMEFGLWVEPEMVNPDSDLYREHPDWVLADPRYEMPLGRNQLVLNLAHPDAYAFIRERLLDLLSNLDISYVKWDMNRDHVQPTHDGRAGTRAQTLALYRLLDELNERFPDVEIESCSSGGGRADFGVLERTKRIWTSDCNDALERQRIQRGFSMLFPPELMGAHIGPPVSHTTRRTHGLGFRGAVAFLGHLGIEWNLLRATDDERAQVKELVRLHKQVRPLLHGGEVVRLDSTDEAAMAQGVISADRSESLIVYIRIGTARVSIPDPVIFAELDPERSYDVSILALPGPSGDFGRSRPAWVEQGSVRLTGDALMGVGVQPPLLDPESALLFHLVAADA